MRKLEWQGQQVEVLKKWKGYELRNEREHYSEIFVMRVARRDLKKYMNGKLAVTDKVIIDYLDGYYGKKQTPITVEWQGRKVELLKSFDWNGHNLKIFQEIRDEKYGQVLNVSLDYVKAYIIGDSVVTDQAVIDYLDDHYGRPVKWRNIVF